MKLDKLLNICIKLYFNWHLLIYLKISDVDSTTELTIKENTTNNHKLNSSDNEFYSSTIVYETLNNNNNSKQPNSNFNHSKSNSNLSSIKKSYKTKLPVRYLSSIILSPASDFNETKEC